MDYKEKYENGVECIQEILGGAGDSIKTSLLRKRLQAFFPELKESENERIRKELADFIYVTCFPVKDLKKKERFLTWLEKQKKPELKEDEGETTRKSLISFLKSPFINENIVDEKVAPWITWLEKQKEPKDAGEISDGYHTFNELYRYRMLYNAAFFNMLPKHMVHKSKRHHDGEECFGGGWFIVMANLPTGQISNHYELKDWDLFQIPEKFTADEWDGHTPQEAADRLYKFLLENGGQVNREALAKGVLRQISTSIINWLDANIANGEMCLSNMECEDIETAVLNADWNKVYAYMKKKLEKSALSYRDIDKKVDELVDEFSHTKIGGYGIPSPIEIDAYRKGMNDAIRSIYEYNKRQI